MREPPPTLPPHEPGTAPECRVGVSPGEVVDRILILELKLARVRDPEKRRLVADAYARLLAEANELLHWLLRLPADAVRDFQRHRRELRRVHEELWDVEDFLRRCEREGTWGTSEFVEKARSVYRLNDRRAALKAAIDVLAGRAPGEVKEYSS